MLKEEQDKQKVREGKDPATDRLVVASFIDAAAHFLKWAKQEHREHPRTARRLRTSFASLTVFFRDKHDVVLKKTGLNFVLYDFRHTFATRLAEAGIDLATIAAILGHSGLRIVERYIHISAEHQRQAMSRYEQIMVQAEKNPVQFPSSFRPVLQ